MSKERDDMMFNAGYLLACCNIVNLHNEPVIAAHVLAEAGITEADVRALNLSEYDATALHEIRDSVSSNRDPIRP